MTRSQPERRPEPAIDAALPAEIRIVRVRSRAGDARIAGALWAVAALIAVAIVKPWGIGGRGPESLQRQAPATIAAMTPDPTPEPTADLTADGLAAPICLGTGGWRIASLETWRTQDVRVWRAIVPASVATGPLDPTIPSVPIVALDLPALGWCAPAYGADRPVGPATVTAWLVDDGRATALTLRQVSPENGATPIAALYLPLTRCPEPAICAPLLPEAVPTPWSSGLIVFRYVDQRTARAAWFAAEVQILGQAEPGVP